MHNGYKVIDVHGHLSTPQEFFGYGYNLILGAPIRLTGRRYRVTLDGEAMAAAQRHHLQVLDDRNIDYQLISPRPYAMGHWGTPKSVTHWTTATNDVIHQVCTMHPDRFGGIAQLPQHTSMDTANCLEELELCVREYGFVGAIVNPDPGGDRQTPGLDQPYWYPLYEKAQALNATLLIHGSFGKDPRTTDPYYTFLAEESLATLLLERSDVFDRFPELRIVVVHCGGAPSRFLTRSISAEPLPNGTLPKNLFFDTCSYDRDCLSAFFRQRGIEHACFGSEAPGSGTAVMNPETGKPSDDLLPVLDSLPMLDDAAKRSILHDNPKRVFPLIKAV